MILRALYDYYQRRKDVAPRGFEYKELGFLIVISKDGDFVRIEDCRIDKKRCNIFLVPKTVSRSGSKSGMFPCMMWDNTRFVLGISKNETPNPEGQYLDAFKQSVRNLLKKHPESERIYAVCKFYDKYPEKDLSPVFANDVLYKDILETTKNISFRIQGDLLIAAEDPAIKEDIYNTENQTINGNICLVTGLKSEIARIHSKTPLPGATFASLVSFQKGYGYDSYGKEQAYNASVSTEAEFAYTTALNLLSSRDSHNKFSIGNRTFLFWSSSDSEASKASEESIFAFFGHTEENDDPNKRIELVQQTFLSIYNGKLTSSKDDRFFILGLAPNSARIAVVYWAELPLLQFARIINQHFEDMEITDARKEKKPFAGLHSILGAVSLEGKSSNVSPNLPDAVVKSIFQGLPYPTSLYQSCIRRIRAEQTIYKTRAAIIKAYLNRLNDSNNKKLDIMLDKENTNQGYLCGRLFAVLENLQYAANGQDSIRSSYMNAASSTPSAIFSTILKLSNNHFGKLSKDKKGLALFFDKQKTEILSSLNDFPDTLDLQDQGRFFLGYYHQKNYKETEQ
mgnify:CR=1 FL=1